MPASSLRLIASRAGQSLAELKRIWVAARRRDNEAKRQLHALVLAHPTLEVIFRAFARQAHEARLSADKEAGKKHKPEREYVYWVRAGSQGPKRTSFVPGGLPSLGKRR